MKRGNNDKLTDGRISARRTGPSADPFGSAAATSGDGPFGSAAATSGKKDEGNAARRNSKDKLSDSDSDSEPDAKQSAKKDYKLPDPNPTTKPLFNQRTKKKVLVLDLDETLVSSYMERGSHSPDENEKKQYKVITANDPNNQRHVVYLRPGVKKFLKDLSKHYDLALFTKGKKDYADAALRAWGLDSLIKPGRRLYRESVDDDGKDLRKFGFSLKDIVLVDEWYDFFKPNKVTIGDKEYPTNGVSISEFAPNLVGIRPSGKIWVPGYKVTPKQVKKSRQELAKLKQFLIKLSKQDDVRPMIIENSKPFDNY